MKDESEAVESLGRIVASSWHWSGENRLKTEGGGSRKKAPWQKCFRKKPTSLLVGIYVLNS